MKTLTQSRAIELLRNGEAQLKSKKVTDYFDVTNLFPDFTKEKVCEVFMSGIYLSINNGELFSRKQPISDLLVIKLKNIVSDDYVGKKGDKFEKHLKMFKKCCKTAKAIIRHLESDYTTEQSVHYPLSIINLRVKTSDVEFEHTDESRAIFDQPKLEVGKWYTNGAITILYTELLENPHGQSPLGLCYGFQRGEWFYDEKRYLNGDWRLATPDEIQTALTNEAVKRGCKAGMWYDRSTFRVGLSFCDAIIGTDGVFKYDEKTNELWLDSYTIFKDGQWAIPYEPISKEEAERRTGCKIV